VWTFVIQFLFCEFAQRQRRSYGAAVNAFDPRFYVD
jgi:hypothetical protein